jgi:hypothetical protein
MCVFGGVGADRLRCLCLPHQLPPTLTQFLWMVRIGGGVYPDHIQEKNYLSEKVNKGGVGGALTFSSASW